MAPEANVESIQVEVVHATPERQLLVALVVPKGTTLLEAIERSGIREEFPDLVVEQGRVGIFGRKMPPETPLRDGDRVEIYRPLIADPKDARRRRAQASEN